MASSRVVMKFKIDFDYKLSKDKKKCCGKCLGCSHTASKDKVVCTFLPANISGVLDDVEGMTFEVQPNYCCKCFKSKR